MNPSSATSLYLAACRAALRCDPQQPESFTELYDLLPFFRDALSCLACGNLLRDPVAPSASTCQHFFCRGCEGGTLRMKPPCGCCRNAQQFEENKQLQVLVDCYRSLCEYVWVITAAEQSTSRIRGYVEVMKMLEEVLEVKQEQVEEKIVEVPQEAKESSQSFKTEASSPCPISVNKTDPDAGVDGQKVENVSSSKDIKTELEPSRLITCSGVDHHLAVQQFSTDTVTINISNGNVLHDGCTSPILLSVEEVLNSLESECSTNQAKSKVPLSDSRSKSSGEVLQAFQATPSGALPPAHPQQPQTGITCQAAAHRKVHLSRKRSRSESDSEMLQPVPIACFTQKPSVASTVPPQAASEPKAQNRAAGVQNGVVLKVSRMLLDSTKNIQKNAESLGAKKVPTKTKIGTPKPKPKPKVSDGALPGNPTKVVYKKPPEKKGCKCGRATQNPSVLTCRGQRCPCYSNRKACLDCICRGCQNSYMANGEKKLEAFAVPEKALEQTRLTLGINLTSISVMSTGSNPGVLSLSARPQMASFLSASPEKEPSFEDPLEMRFDC
ncbi:E3 ubiquitin-protein ligase MSL2a [Pygocentrus nattereri]|uniref:RING-type domain-containing protein n=1 Tax=Pygocentrus nattereri TaxID=42514 RepID=A0A3B4DUH4_PYGNA|nr:E3 ubiquitin-protein ligase MSL2a [Pygocentrus nattereri]XP_037402282.1 E3 ubiquitin-protein ligase MSL2a [Pygocentrus nattereri]